MPINGAPPDEPEPELVPVVELGNIDMTIGHAPNGTKILVIDLQLQLLLPFAPEVARDIATKLTSGIQIHTQMPGKPGGPVL